MFGHQDHKPQQESNNNTDSVGSATTTSTDDYQFAQQDATPQINTVSPTSTPSIASDNDSTDEPTIEAPSSHEQPVQIEPAPNNDVLSPAGGYPQTPSSKIRPGGDSSDEPVFNAPDDGKDNDLAAIKQKALNELFPLIDQLDQTPEERFRTLLMMIQASDNQNLVEAVYEAAHNITDEKIKAQALLDVVNEINYFTQQPQNQ